LQSVAPGGRRPSDGALCTDQEENYMRTTILAAVAAVVATSAFAAGMNEAPVYPNMEHLSKATAAKPAPALHVVAAHKHIVHRG
jgi:hypothetical protein